MNVKRRSGFASISKAYWNEGYLDIELNLDAVLDDAKVQVNCRVRVVAEEPKIMIQTSPPA